MGRSLGEYKVCLEGPKTNLGHRCSSSGNGRGRWPKATTLFWCYRRTLTRIIPKATTYDLILVLYLPPQSPGHFAPGVSCCAQSDNTEHLELTPLAVLIAPSQNCRYWLEVGKYLLRPRAWYEASEPLHPSCSENIEPAGRCRLSPYHTQS